MAMNCKELTVNQAAQAIIMEYQGCLALNSTDDKIQIMAAYLEGEPGVGKSAIPKMLAAYFNYYLEDIRANQMSPDDAGGIRMPDPDTKETIWYPPYWMPREDGKVIKNGKEYDGTILFFDELASADDRVRKPLFGVFLDREMNGRHLPNNCIVMAAGNEAATGTMVFELDNATRSRFTTLRIVAALEDWITNYATEANVDPSVVAYLKNNMGEFCQTEYAIENDLDLYGNPRSWVHVSNKVKAIMHDKKFYDSEKHLEALEAMVAGKVGKGTATKFMAVFKTVSAMSSLFDLLQAMEKTPEKLKQMWPKEVSQLGALSFSMMKYPRTVEQGIEMFKLTDHFPKDSSVPFQESIPAIREVIIKRLREGGANNNEMKAFSTWNKQTTDETIQGPLIKISM